MKMLTRLLATTTVLLILLAGCGGDARDEDSGATPEAQTQEETGEAPDAEATGDTALTDDQMIAEGEAVFTGQGICYTCHGQDGTGTQLAPDLTDDEWINIPEPITHEKVVTLVKSGVAEPVEYPAPMPPMGGASLSDEQIQAVSAYVLQLSE